MASYLNHHGVPSVVVPLSHYVDVYLGEEAARARTREVVRDAITSLSPRAIGITATFSYIYPKALEIAAFAREAAPPGTPIIIGGPHVTYVSTLPRGQRAIAPGMILVHIVSVLDAGGEVVHSEPFVLRASGPNGLLTKPAALRQWIQHALAGHSAAPALRGAELRIVRDVLDLHTAAVRQVLRRLEAQRTLIPSTARELVQASLFDRGALRAAAARSRAQSEQAEAFDHAVSLASPELRCQSVLAAVLVVTGARRP